MKEVERLLLSEALGRSHKHEGMASYPLGMILYAHNKGWLYVD